MAVLVQLGFGSDNIIYSKRKGKPTAPQHRREELGGVSLGYEPPGHRLLFSSLSSALLPCIWESIPPRPILALPLGMCAVCEDGVRVTEGPVEVVALDGGESALVALVVVWVDVTETGTHWW